MKYFIYIFYIAAAVGLYLIVGALLDFFKPEPDAGPDENFMGIGKANGIYLVKSGGVYIVAGKKIKDKQKAVHELIALIKENGLTPPDTYFRTIKMIDNKKK